jgi:DNA (cytosine-5)-methyltransferase 1
MSVRFSQLLLDTHEEIICDLFAGGGGASLGIEYATGRMVDVAINHDAAAVSMHMANHPQTTHHVCDVFEADPRVVTGGRPVGLLWASPDCTDHSKAKGGKPIRNRKRRALAWVVQRWAGQVRPRVTCLENVEEFVEWGPLVGPPGELRRCPKRKGETFRAFVRGLERLGYRVEWRELRACDFGAPTIRKRLFLVARCDRDPIVWPEPTHGAGLLPFRTAADCIDWRVPMLSIFATPDEAKAWARERRAEGWKMGTPRRPLAEATLRRIATGIRRFILDAPDPYVVGHIAPSLVQTGYGERNGQGPRALDLQVPLGTIVGSTKHALVAAYLAKHFTGVDGADLREPTPTVTTIDHNSLVAASLAKLGASGDRHALVYAFLSSYYGVGVGQALGSPARTVTTKDRLGLVTVEVAGEPYVIVDIAMRMLQPRELYRAQGFPDSYRIERGAEGRKLTKTEQVRLVGNSVSPPVAAAIVRANCPELVARDEARIGVA